MCETVKIGQKVFDLTFDVYDPVNREFKVMNLSSLQKEKKWVVLFFYPADFTFVCPTELKDLGDKYDELKRLGVEVISFSTDTKFVHLAWKDSELLLKDIKFPMGADPNGKVSKTFGVYNEENGLARRGTFIIDPDGTLVGMEITFDNVGRNADELLRKVKAHIYLSKHPDEACPARWTEGEKTLKPSAKLVGKVGEALKS
jgi:peroxiredoxin (alkyl hydroperoxide reductase subunit C)